ncbi:hypothetical protein JNUCC83_08815 [Vagococcus sp. JNUCC 83]
MKKRHRKVAGMNKAKKKIGVLLLFGVLIIGGMIVRGSHKSIDVKDNSLYVPSVHGKINEVFEPNKPIVIGGESQAKEININNDGNTNLFVRVMVFPEIMTDSENLLASNIGKEVLVDLGTDWIDGKDGYYYYKKIVKPGNMSTNLFEKVKLSSDLDDNYIGSHLSMQVKAETITNATYVYRVVWWNGTKTDVPIDNNLRNIDNYLSSLVKK